ncbi:MAG: PAS domain S-box protein [Comamonas sp.]|nr:PAS domain S-box protein [Comamonas sp.]
MSVTVWEHIVRDVSDALIFIDTAGTIRAWNPAAETLFGFTAAQALGQSVHLIIPMHLRDGHDRGFARAMQTGRCSHPGAVRTTRSLHADGRKLYVDMGFSVVKDERGQVLGSVAMARDATARYLAERQAGAQKGDASTS